MIYKNIFFSYSRADASDFALQLALDLQKEGFNVWIDQQDIRAGSEWDLEIEKALETCDCLLFIESEKSVTSANVLDEVYYAIDENKMVIPLIYKDSKTPFRIKRLQHIDFSKSYEMGLANLLYELKTGREAASALPASTEATQNPTHQFIRKYGLISIIALLILVAFAAIILWNNKKMPPVEITDGTAIVTDTATGKKDSIAPEVAIRSAQVPAQTGQRKERNVPVVPPNKNEVKKPLEKPLNLHETFVGKWDLTGVEPTARAFRGSLNIEEVNEHRVNIVSNFQFYFVKTNDTAFFSVFNGYAGCSSCVMKNEMTIIDNQVEFGAQVYQILRENQPGVGNAGDTTMSAGPNSAIRAKVSLHLINKTTALIKVEKSVPTAVSMGLVVKPFVYTFHFTKREY